MLTAQQRSEMASQMARDRWASMTPEERSAEMKRRAAKRKKGKKGKAKTKRKESS